MLNFISFGWQPIETLSAAIRVSFFVVATKIVPKMELAGALTDLLTTLCHLFSKLRILMPIFPGKKYCNKSNYVSKIDKQLMLSK